MATAPVHGSPGESFAHCFNEIAFNLVRGQFSQNPTVLVNRDVVERPGVRIHVTADIGIFRRQPPVRCQGKCRRITAAGNGGSRQIFQEHFIHKYLIALTNKHRLCVAIRRINHRNPVCRQQHLTLHSCWRILNTGTDTRNIKASVLHLLQFHGPHAVQVIICINLNFLYLLDCRTLIFQFFIDGLRDFIADIRNGRPDFSQVRRKLTVINLRPQLLGQMCFPDFSL